MRNASSSRFACAQRPSRYERQPVQLAHRRGPRRLLGQGPQQAAGLLVPLAAEGVGGVLEARLEAGDAVGADRVAQLVVALGRPGAGATCGRRRPRALQPARPRPRPASPPERRVTRPAASARATCCARRPLRPRRAAHPRRSTPRAPSGRPSAGPAPRAVTVRGPPGVGGATLERPAGTTPGQATPTAGTGELVGACAAPIVATGGPGTRPRSPDPRLRLRSRPRPCRATARRAPPAR